MLIIDFFTNFDSFVNEVCQEDNLIDFIHSFCVLLLNLTGYLYIYLKFFKVLCYSKMTFEWLPMVNPHIWPFSVFHVLTASYFSFWSNVLPSIKFDHTSVEISGVVALEVLNSLIYFCVRFTNLLITVIEQAEKISVV